MNLSDFIKSKNERFSLLYALYLIFYFIFVLGIDIDFILYYIITALIATVLALITIIFQLEVIVDNFFFKFRKQVDMNIYNLMNKIWSKRVKNTNCEDACSYLKDTKCKYDFDVYDTKVQFICMNRCFYPIINSDKDNNSSKIFVYQGFLNYYICIIIILISALSPIFVNITLVFKLNDGLLTGEVEQMLINGIVLQIYLIILLFIFQKVRNLTEQNGHKFSMIFRFITIFFLLLYYLVSIYLTYLISLITEGIYYNSIMIYLVITTLSLILSLVGRKSKRVKDYILQNQKLQLDKIIDLELKQGSVTNKLRKAICQDVVREEFYD